ncbi:hypothetical protein DFS33DRAFT_1275412 [Desarmillaria ectypa]|nr:hypothetical protein DFS33DRAFT_1275412 [Desarmillaria ectypa]
MSKRENAVSLVIVAVVAKNKRRTTLPNVHVITEELDRANALTVKPCPWGVEPSPELTLLVILSMNMFPAGSRIFYYDSTGQLVRGVVESTTRMADTRQWRNYDLAVNPQVCQKVKRSMWMLCYVMMTDEENSGSYIEIHDNDKRPNQ